MAGAIRKAERVATAMDSKAFGALPSRTYYRRMRVTGADWTMVAATALVIAAVLFVMARTGLLAGFGAVPGD
jgi:energy-coupling factor transport system permease protein